MHSAVGRNDSIEASEHDKFAAHLYRSRREYRSACERAGKSDKQIERMCHLDGFRLPRAWASKVTFASGRNFCGLVIENVCSASCRVERRLRTVATSEPHQTNCDRATSD